VSGPLFLFVALGTPLLSRADELLLPGVLTEGEPNPILKRNSSRGKSVAGSGASVGRPSPWSAAIKFKIIFINTININTSTSISISIIIIIIISSININININIIIIIIVIIIIIAITTTVIIVLIYNHENALLTPRDRAVNSAVSSKKKSEGNKESSSMANLTWSREREREKKMQMRHRSRREQQKRSLAACGYHVRNINYQVCRMPAHLQVHTNVHVQERSTKQLCNYK
jgi:hypothetical protein